MKTIVTSANAFQMSKFSGSSSAWNLLAMITRTRTNIIIKVTAAPRMPNHRVPRNTSTNTHMFRVTAFDASTVIPISFFRTLTV